MELKIKISGREFSYTEEDDPENIEKLFELIKEFTITKHARGNQLKNNVFTPNPTISDIGNIGLTSVAVDKTTAPNPTISDVEDIGSTAVAVDKTTVPNQPISNIEDIGLTSVAVDRKTAENWYNDIYSYIKSKPNFEHDLSELMDRVLGKQLHYIKEPKVYNTFRAKTRLARKNIAKEENIMWDSFRTTYGNGSNPSVFTIKK